MTEKEFRKAFAGTGWDVDYIRDKSGTRVQLTSKDTMIIAGATWASEYEDGHDIRGVAFCNAAADLAGTPRDGAVAWAWPGWTVDGTLAAAPAWYRTPGAGRPNVGSVEEFAFKLSMLEF